MTINSTPLRPGLLVSLKSHTHGNVSYRRTLLQAAAVGDDGTETETWETQRIVTDPDELNRAKAARGKARQIISSVCTNTAFGLLCPEADADQLEIAIREARQICDDFNDTAKISRVSVYVMTGKVAPDDVEAIKSINSEVRRLMETMNKGIAEVDVKTIRDAASKARELGAMLTPEAQGRVQVAIEAARKAATQIKKAGEAAAQQIDRTAIRKIADMRMSFIDMDDVQEVARVQQQGGEIDIDVEMAS